MLEKVLEPTPTSRPSRAAFHLDVGLPSMEAQGKAETADVVLDIDGLCVDYDKRRAVRDVSLQIREREITAFIGPSGCGKTTVLRCLNRMNDLIPSARVSGTCAF